MPSYLTVVNQLIREHASKLPDSAIHMGENIDKGSCLCGITRGLASGRILNVGNCENTHAGTGLGILRNGGTAVLYVKQLDFLLLAADQLVNTWNLIRLAGEPAGSFTIVVIVCDQGFQGPQSSFNALAELAALARVDSFTINTRLEAGNVFSTQYGQPGFRVIALSQRLFGEPILDPLDGVPGDGTEYCYGTGTGATIACLGFSVSRGMDLAGQLARGGLPASVFSLQQAGRAHWPAVTSHAIATKNLHVLDDGKGMHAGAHRLAHQVLAMAPDCRLRTYFRPDPLEIGVSMDAFAPDFTHA